MILVTGGAGFIGSNFVLAWLAQSDEPVVNVDKLTYAGNRSNLAAVHDDPRHVFVQADIADGDTIGRLLEEHRPRAVINLAAETHVDRSIPAPHVFMATNVMGTFALLESVRPYWDRLEAREKDSFRFLHVSTDEAYGALAPDDPPFSERTPYAPNSPYAASKASSDHLVRAWWHTYGLPVLTTNCSNNYGPFQFPEKLIPLVIHKALAGEALPIYGDGKQVRDWLFVDDHCRAIMQVLGRGHVGETYNIGGGEERENVAVVRLICTTLDALRPRRDGASYAEQIAFVRDRPGHDRRYAIDARKITRELGWKPLRTFDSGLRETIQWYLANHNWVSGIATGGHPNA